MRVVGPRTLTSPRSQGSGPNAQVSPWSPLVATAAPARRPVRPPATLPNRRVDGRARGRAKLNLLFHSYPGPRAPGDVDRIIWRRRVLIWQCFAGLTGSGGACRLEYQFQAN